MGTRREIEIFAGRGALLLAFLYLSAIPVPVRQFFPSANKMHLAASAFAAAAAAEIRLSYFLH